MSAGQFLQYVADILFILIFIDVVVEAVRRPLRSNVDIALFFGLASLVIVLGLGEDALGITPGPFLAALAGSLAMAMPYVFIRLVDDFAGVPILLRRVAEVGLALVIVALFLLRQPYPPLLFILLVIYFLGFEVYGAVVIVRSADRASGVTRRRLHAVAVGSVFLGLAILFAVLQTIIPATAGVDAPLTNVCAVLSGVAYFIGFAPPAWFRRSWQEPELRAFLAHASNLPDRLDLEATVQALEEGAAQSLGAEGAAIGRWDGQARVLRFQRAGEPVELPADGPLLGRVLAKQQATLSSDISHDNPTLARAYGLADSTSVLVAPIAAGKNRLGILIAYARRAPILVESDLELAQLLADQTAVILENWTLGEEIVRSRARTEALAAADAERQRLYALLVQAPSAVCQHRGPEHTIEFANPLYLRLVGQRSIVGMSGQVTQPDLEGQSYGEILGRVYRTDESFVGSEQRVRLAPGADGAAAAAYFKFVYQPTHDLDGAVDGVLVHGSEVTEQVVARQTVERTADRIARLQEITAALSEHHLPREVARIVASQATAVLGAATGAVAHLVDDGAAFEVLWESGYHEEVPSVHETLQSWRRFPVSESTPFGDAVRTAEPIYLESREARLARYPHLANVQETIDLNASATTPLVIDGRVIGALYLNFAEARHFSEEDRAFMLALSHHCAQALERARFRADLIRRTHDLEAANKELEAFSYSVAHDLRAPLRAVDGFSRILLEEYARELPEEGQRYIGLVRTNAQQMGTLIDDLLSFSRLGRQPLQRQTVLPAELAREEFERLLPEQEGRHVTISIGDLPPCEADPAQLRHLFSNLLANALKFTRRREEAIIEIGACNDGGEQVYWIKDNGVGFDMRYAHKLFGVFQRLHRTEEYEGTGVGLAIVQRVAHRHGGRVWAEAEIDRGATFYFTLQGRATDG